MKKSINVHSKQNKLQYSISGKFPGLRSSITALSKFSTVLKSIQKNGNWKEEVDKIETDSSSFLVTTNPYFLYNLGKIAIQTAVDIKSGVQALSDYIVVLKNFESNQAKFKQHGRKMELKCKFWIGLGLYYSGNNSESTKLIEEIIPELEKSNLQKYYIQAIRLLEDKLN